MRRRGFEVVAAYAEKDVRLPRRKTGASAGYDIEAAEDVVLPPQAVGLVPTGLKAYMQADEYLGVYVRSGFSLKHAVSLINGQGVIDADYYDNEENEGHIVIAMFNHGREPVAIPRGMRVAQGIFYKYLPIDGDVPGEGASRRGGLGSTGE